METDDWLLGGQARRNPGDAPAQAAPVADTPTKGEYRSGHGDSATHIRATHIRATHIRATHIRATHTRAFTLPWAGRQPGPTSGQAKTRPARR